jgi:hypothetical protein
MSNSQSASSQPVKNLKKNSAPEAQKGAGAPAGQEKPGKKQKAAKELAAELKVLRSAFKEIVEHFCLRVDSEFLEMIRVLEKDQILNERIVLPQAKTAQQLARKIHGLKLKPSKGKLKDIVQIDKLVEKVAGKMPVQP